MDRLKNDLPQSGRLSPAEEFYPFYPLERLEK
jgi:hypothetical protein